MKNTEFVSTVISALNNANPEDRVIELSNNVILVARHYSIGLPRSLSYSEFKAICERLYQHVSCPAFNIVSKMQIVGRCKLSYKAPHRSIVWENVT